MVPEVLIGKTQTPDYLILINPGTIGSVMGKAFPGLNGDLLILGLSDLINLCCLFIFITILG